jgi:hypothetical protein
MDKIDCLIREEGLIEENDIDGKIEKVKMEEKG